MKHLDVLINRMDWSMIEIEDGPRYDYDASETKYLDLVHSDIVAKFPEFDQVEVELSVSDMLGNRITVIDDAGYPDPADSTTEAFVEASIGDVYGAWEWLVPEE